MSAAMFVFGLVLFAFFDGSASHVRFAELIWVAPMTTLPAFFFVFVSRRSLTWAMWTVAVVNYFGELVLILDDCSRGACVTTNAALLTLGALLGPQVIFSILTAGLVEYAYRLERRGSLEIN
jgi:hypothetical protein